MSPILGLLALVGVICIWRGMRAWHHYNRAWPLEQEKSLTAWLLVIIGVVCIGVSALLSGVQAVQNLTVYPG